MASRNMGWHFKLKRASICVDFADRANYYLPMGKYPLWAFIKIKYREREQVLEKSREKVWERERVRKRGKGV